MLPCGDGYSRASIPGFPVARGECGRGREASALVTVTGSEAKSYGISKAGPTARRLEATRGPHMAWRTNGTSLGATYYLD